ncbi:hypothetical protein SAMN05660477_01021 [Soonwooa buanensis]|uniref:G8 domain-containing protein n=1 Tax=Soonwooa buanensis TaxID=619805 RepID=A0A1T5DU63_9FLAO|nr:hypothetical protein [Soonwooa buanensis]SKB75277.1 hypothetical protein SAMN05660477_01021 [Soonwooa buanensis]
MKKIFSFLTILCITHIFAADYYWVGGSGNWSDINHWRTTSGGTSLPSVIPGPTDNVFFDAKSNFTSSSKTVTIDNTANCHNIIFSGSAITPTLTQSGGQTLNIYGSSEWQAGMGVININMIYYRNTGNAKTIKSNAVVSGNTGTKILFEETKSITLLDDYQVGYELYHNAGTWITNSHQVKIDGRFYANQGNTPRTIEFGSSKIYLTTSSPYFQTNSAVTTINAGTSHIYFTGRVTSSSYGLTAYQGQNFYNVTFEEQANINLTGSANFNQVEFKGNGNISGNNTFKTLIFAPAKNYIIEANKKQTITNLFSTNTPACEGWTSISSSSNATTTEIVAASGVSIIASGTILKNITTSGGASFIANNSIGDGVTDGWQIPPAVGQDLYWVGGSGNWNDRMHWSKTSGGTGGYCVPGPYDNTFIDGGSGFTLNDKTITLDKTSYTRNINFAGSQVPPILTQKTIGSNEESLNIYGSSEWQNGMININVAKIFYRNTGEAKTIKSNNVITGALSSIIYFEEESSISLLDDFIANYELYHQAGTWTTNNHQVTINGRFYAIYGTKPKVINMGSSNFYLPYTVPYFQTNSSSTTINAGTSHIHFTNTTSNSYGLIAGANQRYYNVSFDNSSTAGSITAQTGTVYFNQVEFKGNGTINGNNNFYNLILAPTKNYSFPAGATQTITNLLSASTPKCGGWSTITSSTPGSLAKIEAASNVTINVSGVIMQDISGAGGAIFIAQNSIDNGNNNPGWRFPTTAGQDLYWVGGSGNWNDKMHWSQSSNGAGGYCVPGPSDNTFFNQGSGFTTASKVVVLDNTAYTRNITFSGSAVPPTVTQAGSQTLNIYGSSEWQNGMGTVNINRLYYRHTGDAKTIKSNDVISGNNGAAIYFEEENTISLLDNYKIGYELYHQAGTWITNNNDVTIYGRFYANYGTKPRTITMGSSNFYLPNSSPYFHTHSPYVTINAGTSQLIFTGNTTASYGLSTYDGQQFNNVIFESRANASINSTNGTTSYNAVTFKGSGSIKGINNFKNLEFSSGKSYTLDASKTQTIENLILGGTPCDVTFMQSSIPGTHANVNITGTTTKFNFGNLKDINASGKALHFAEQSTIANQNNSNITFDPYNPGSFSGFGPDWLKHNVNVADPTTYILTTNGFYGNLYTTYKWYKVNDARYNPNVSISDAKDIDIRNFGSGTYRVEVSYSNGTQVTCKLAEEILITAPDRAFANPNLRIRVR